MKIRLLTTLLTLTVVGCGGAEDAAKQAAEDAVNDAIDNAIPDLVQEADVGVSTPNGWDFLVAIDVNDTQSAAFDNEFSISLEAIENASSKKGEEKVNLALRKIVNTKEGTAGFANIDGYEIGGKTGTAQKSNSGGYSRNKINTFASIFPASDPKYVLVVMLDEPKPNKDYIYEYKDGSGWKIKGTQFNTAGWTAVEVTGKIIEKIGPILATKY